MKRRKEKYSASKLQLEMTPMIDVVFNLLIFFLCSPFKIPEGQLDAFLPKGDVTDQQPPIEKVVIRLIDTAGEDVPKICIGFRVLSTYENGEPAFNELASQLMEKREKAMEISDKPLPVEIDSDKGVMYRYVVGVLNACTKARIKDIRFTLPIGQEPEKPPG